MNCDTVACIGTMLSEVTSGSNTQHGKPDVENARQWLGQSLQFDRFDIFPDYTVNFLTTYTLLCTI